MLSTAHDVSREWRFISALAPTAVPVPSPVVYCADTAVTGAEFYVMGFVEGLVLADTEAGMALAYQARVRAAEHLVDVLVALHALDPVAVGLGDMVRKTGYLERQLRRWHAQVHATGAAELALLDEVHDLLARRIPEQADGIVHGDYRAGNVAFGPDGAIRAVFDWELATSGDPMADLGWLASNWQDPGEELPPTTPGPSTVPGFPAGRRSWRVTPGCPAGTCQTCRTGWRSHGGGRPASTSGCGPGTSPGTWLTTATPPRCRHRPSQARPSGASCWRRPPATRCAREACRGGASAAASGVALRRSRDPSQ